MEAEDLDRPPLIGRRTVLRATAWSVPAIVLATSTPAAAASVAILTFTLADLEDTADANVKEFDVVYDYTGSETGTWTLAVIVSPTGAATFDGVVAFEPKVGANGVIVLVGTLTLTAASDGTGTMFLRATKDGATVDSPAVILPPYSVVGNAPMGSIPIAFLTVSAYGLSNLNAGGAGRGPLEWAGGQIQYQGEWDGPPEVAIGYRIQAIKDPGTPGETVMRERVGTVHLGLYETDEVRDIPGIDLVWGDEPDEPVEPGTCVVRLTVYGSDGSLTAESNTLTIV